MNRAVIALLGIASIAVPLFAHGDEIGRGGELSDLHLEPHSPDAKEIARLLGISEGAAKIRLHRAREKLRALLKGACRFSTDERGVFVCEPKTDPATR